MKRTMGDKITSKISRGKIETVHTTREEMADLIDGIFIQQAVTKEDFEGIWKVVKRGFFFDKIINSKDERYELRSQSIDSRGLRKYVWIYDKKEEMYYDYDYWCGTYGKFKKMVKEKLEQAQNKSTM